MSNRETSAEQDIKRVDVGGEALEETVNPKQLSMSSHDLDYWQHHGFFPSPAKEFLTYGMVYYGSQVIEGGELYSTLAEFAKRFLSNPTPDKIDEIIQTGSDELFIRLVDCYTGTGFSQHQLEAAMSRAKRYETKYQLVLKHPAYFAEPEQRLNLVNQHSEYLILALAEAGYYEPTAAEIDELIDKAETGSRKLLKLVGIETIALNSDQALQMISVPLAISHDAGVLRRNFRVASILLERGVLPPELVQGEVLESLLLAEVSLEVDDFFKLLATGVAMPTDWLEEQVGRYLNNFDDLDYKHQQLLAYNKMNIKFEGVARQTILSFRIKDMTQALPASQLAEIIDEECQTAAADLTLLILEYRLDDIKPANIEAVLSNPNRRLKHYILELNHRQPDYSLLVDEQIQATVDYLATDKQSFLEEIRHIFDYNHPEAVDDPRLEWFWGGQLNRLIATRDNNFHSALDLVTLGIEAKVTDFDKQLERLLAKETFEDKEALEAHGLDVFFRHDIQLNDHHLNVVITELLPKLTETQPVLVPEFLINLVNVYGPAITEQQSDFIIEIWPEALDWLVNSSARLTAKQLDPYLKQLLANARLPLKPAWRSHYKLLAEVIRNRIQEFSPAQNEVIMKWIEKLLKDTPDQV